jgi:hypothetical protein
MANRDLKKTLKKSTGAVLSGETLSADTATESFALSGLEYFGIVVDLGAISGTTPTLDIKAQVSFDAGTTWLNAVPPAPNTSAHSASTNQTAQVAQITTSDIQTAEYWVNPFPNDNNVIARFNFDLGGTSPTIVVDNAYLIARRWGKY